MALVTVVRVCAEPRCGRQVTNPPIDPLREGLVMSLAVRLGKRGNLLEPGPGAYSQARARSKPPTYRDCVCGLCICESKKAPCPIKH